MINYILIKMPRYWESVLDVRVLPSPDLKKYLEMAAKDNRHTSVSLERSYVDIWDW